MKVVKMSQVAKVPTATPLLTGNLVTRQDVFQPSDSGAFNFRIINFSAGSRSKFHTHTSDQILIILEGTGTVATDSEQRTVTAGDAVLIAAGENHWHGAPGKVPMAHIAITSKDSKTIQTEP